MPLRIFFVTGEASGEQSAVLLAAEMERRLPGLGFEGIGGERMAEAGFGLTWRTVGWASLGPLSAIGKIPLMLRVVAHTVFALVRRPPDLVILVDFGAVNLRLAQILRRCGFRRPILYCFPPGAWFDHASQARKVAAVSVPLVPFTHQRDFYRAHDLPVLYYGHPLASVLTPRPSRPVAPRNGGHIALLPGSRDGELDFHLPRLLEMFALLRSARPRLEGVILAADSRAQTRLQRAIAGHDGLRIARGTREHLRDVDAAVIASGTAVLEAALLDVPCVALYVVSAAQASIGRRIWHRPYVTLPNLILGRALVPEFLQEAATPSTLATAVEELLTAPTTQLNGFSELREAVGGGQTLEQWAHIGLTLAQSATADLAQTTASLLGAQS